MVYRGGMVFRRTVLRALSLGLLVLPACAPSGPAAHGPTDAPAAATTTSTPSASAAHESPEATPEKAAPPPAGSTSAVAAASPAGSAAGSRPAPAIAFPRSPKPIEPKHGGQYWAVFLALGKPGPDHERLADAWTATKLPSVRGVGCHEGPGAPTSEEAFLAVYFKTERDAKAFAQGVKPEGPRVANVKVFCLD